MITKEQFALRQPFYPDESPSDEFYWNLSNTLLQAWDESGIMNKLHPKLKERLVLCIIGYYQDVITDGGLWRSFINECCTLYGKTLPYYSVDEEYLDYEYNKVDVRFLIWYGIAMQDESNRLLDPENPQIEDLAEVFNIILESNYDEAPIVKEYRLGHELEIHAEEDRDAVMNLGQWLFLHSYLLTPSFALTLSEKVKNLSKEEMAKPEVLQDILGQSMAEDPIGPLALYMKEWLHLIIEGKLPEKKGKKEEEKPLHSYYTRFMEATGGKRIKFFADYASFNRFLIDGMGWKDNEEHLPQLKESEDFIIFVDPYRGMLVARNVAKCFNHPDNPCYDKEFAAHNSINLLTERGYCPCDLVKYGFKEGMLPDAVFPESTNHSLVQENYDFIARCYLQLYYRD